MDDGYMSAGEAAEALGVKLMTLYAYVSRKRLRSRAVPGSKARVYWRQDVETLQGRNGRSEPIPLPGDLQRDSKITLITTSDLYYRGRDVADLAQGSSLETVASILWDVEEEDVFTKFAPRSSTSYAQLAAVLGGRPGVDRAIAHIPFLEHADPRSFDLTPRGMARTGADILRWLTAIFFDQTCARAEPIHLQIAGALDLDPVLTDLVRRLMVVSADHGFEEATFAARVIASTGVPPWRAVSTGLSVAVGRSSKFGSNYALKRFVAEIVEVSTTEEPIIRRLREGEVIPGFTNRCYEGSDPRARVLLDYCDRFLGDEREYGRFRAAISLVHELTGAEPNFPILVNFISLRMGLAQPPAMRSVSSTETPFLIARASGWIAHAIEQYQAGEVTHRDLLYRGRLPDIAQSLRA